MFIQQKQIVTFTQKVGKILYPKFKLQYDIDPIIEQNYYVIKQAQMIRQVDDRKNQQLVTVTFFTCSFLRKISIEDMKNYIKKQNKFMQKINHSNILRSYCFYYKIDNHIELFSESIKRNYIPLGEYLKLNSISEKQILDILSSLIQLVQYMNRMKLYDSVITPNNLFVSKQQKGKIKIMLTKIFEDRFEKTLFQKKVGLNINNINYQYCLLKDNSIKPLIFSFVCTMYYLINRNHQHLIPCTTIINGKVQHLTQYQIKKQLKKVAQKLITLKLQHLKHKWEIIFKNLGNNFHEQYWTIEDILKLFKIMIPTITIQNYRSWSNTAQRKFIRQLCIDQQNPQDIEKQEKQIQKLVHQVIQETILFIKKFQKLKLIMLCKNFFEFISVLLIKLLKSIIDENQFISLFNCYQDAHRFGNFYQSFKYRIKFQNQEQFKCLKKQQKKFIDLYHKDLPPSEITRQILTYLEQKQFQISHLLQIPNEISQLIQFLHKIDQL